MCEACRPHTSSSLESKGSTIQPVLFRSGIGSNPPHQKTGLQSVKDLCRCTFIFRCHRQMTVIK